jgi:translocation and assembly module TamB
LPPSTSATSTRRRWSGARRRRWRPAGPAAAATWRSTWKSWCATASACAAAASTSSSAASSRLTGTTGNLNAIGGFRVRSGRLDLLGQRVRIERGQLDFVGDLDPRISFAAVARRDGFEIELLVSGRATAPEITITSSPMLPQEEALSRLIFGSSLTELSPFQIAQLAAAVATLSGGGGGGLMDGLGNAIGLDRFEVIQTETGETRVSAGRQITENG